MAKHVLMLDTNKKNIIAESTIQHNPYMSDPPAPMQ